MGRIIGAVVAGYLAMAGVIFLVCMGAYALMGAERVFKPGSWEPSIVWVLTMFISGFVAAMIGGWVALKIADSAQGSKWLAVLILVLGIVSSLFSRTTSPSKESRPAGISMMDARKNAYTPAWVALALPVIGVAGVLAGGRRRSPVSAPSPA